MRPPKVVIILVVVDVAAILSVLWLVLFREDDIKPAIPLFLFVCPGLLFLVIVNLVVPLVVHAAYGDRPPPDTNQGKPAQFSISCLMAVIAIAALALAFVTVLLKNG
jgi:hypothetical protein